MQKVPKKINTTLVMTILFIALVESAAIYGLIIAFQLAS
jgi:F0F1-type ATP synthase membrane subunit c/vacuolar-type H+-ATPase subunit K